MWGRKAEGTLLNSVHFELVREERQKPVFSKVFRFMIQLHKRAGFYNLPDMMVAAVCTRARVYCISKKMDVSWLKWFSGESRRGAVTSHRSERVS